MISIVVTLPIRTRNESNERSLSHWPRTKRAKAHRTHARGAVYAAGRKAGMPVIFIGRDGFPCLEVDSCVVTMTRVSAGKLDDDGLRSALKATRDGIADALGIDDGDARVTYCYAQERGKVREYAVRIEIRERT